MATTSSAPQDVSSKPGDGEDAPTEPVREARTSDRFALLWIALMVLSFLVTLVLLFWAAAQIP